MPLTEAQKTALAADIAANTAVVNGSPINALPQTLDNAVAVAQWYSQDAAPAFFVLRSSYSPDQAREAILSTAGAANQLDALTGSKRDTLLWLIGGTTNPSMASVRSSFDDATGTQNTLKAAVLSGCRRPATRVEKLFAVAGSGPGTGTGALGSTGNPASAAYEGGLSLDDLRNLWGI